MQLICKSLAYKTIFLICSLLSSTIPLFSQESEDRIDELINEGNFEEAIQVSKAFLEQQPDNPRINFRIGYCYMNTSLKKAESIPYLLKSTELFKQTNDQSAMALEAKFYLGKAYHKNYEFAKALEVFRQMKEQVSNKEMLAAIEEEMAQCENGIELKKHPVNRQITNLGDIINSSYSDHSPVLSADESVLIFTSRRKRLDNEMVNPDGQYNEDIYISHFDGERWSPPKSISSNINTDEHEASIGLSADGQELLIYSEKDGGTILSSRLIGEEWTAPDDLGSNINTRWRETHASLSADGKLLYFTSDRPGGYGGLDIYVSEKNANGTWGKAKNLGPAINTEKDEEGPFIHYNGTTLYFSSKGHNTMGGFDIFSSEKNEFGTWSIPENMGYPVNTTEDDVFFVMTADGKRAYFSSFREDGSGNNDIFMMGLPEAKEKPVTVVKGVVSACKSDIDNVRIIVYNVDNMEITGIYKPNIATGKYLFILTKGKDYEASYEISGTQILKESFHIDENADFQVLYKPIELESTTPCDEYVGVDNEKVTEVKTTTDVLVEPIDSTKVFVENIMFKINNAEVTYFRNNLKKLVDYLKSNPETVIEIIGYSDTQGPETYNLNLSKRRAKTVYQYLVANGVNPSQLSYKGAGEKNQLTINNYKNGSYVWQSLPYNRRVEFTIVKDESNQLIIKQFNIPKLYLIENENIESEDISVYDNKFTIQLGAYSKPVSTERFKQLKNIQVYFTGQYYLYAYGEYDSEDKAAEALLVLRSYGFSDAFIRRIAYYFPKQLK